VAISNALRRPNRRAAAVIRQNVKNPHLTRIGNKQVLPIVAVAVSAAAGGFEREKRL